MYGKSLAITMETQLSSTIIENPEMLKYQQETRTCSGTLGSSAEAPLPKLSNVVNGESLEDIRKVQLMLKHATYTLHALYTPCSTTNPPNKIRESTSA